MTTLADLSIENEHCVREPGAQLFADTTPAGRLRETQRLFRGKVERLLNDIGSERPGTPPPAPGDDGGAQASVPFPVATLFAPAL